MKRVCTHPSGRVIGDWRLVRSSACHERFERHTHGRVGKRHVACPRGCSVKRHGPMSASHDLSDSPDTSIVRPERSRLARQRRSSTPRGWRRARARTTDRSGARHRPLPGVFSERSFGAGVHVLHSPHCGNDAAQVSAASTLVSGLAPRRHSFVLGRGLRNPIVWGIGAVSSDCEAWRGDPASGPT